MTAWMVLGGLCTGTGMALAAWWFTVLSADAGDELLLTVAERRRRRALEASSRTCRWLGPLVEALAAWNRRQFAALLARLERPLRVLGMEAWRADQYLAVKQLEGLGLAVVLGVVGARFFEPTTAFLAALGGGLLFPLIRVQALRRKAEKHLARLRARLPCALDLMALMLEAGTGTLQECLRQAAAENHDHPLGQELNRLVMGTDQGASLADLLREMDQRLDDLDFRELVRAIQVAVERGTPLKQALRDLANHLHERQIQRLEKSAEEAKVHITWPAILVMGACLVIVAAPLVLAVIGAREGEGIDFGIFGG